MALPMLAGWYSGFLDRFADERHQPGIQRMAVLAAIFGALYCQPESLRIGDSRILDFEAFPAAHAKVKRLPVVPVNASHEPPLHQISCKSLAVRLSVSMPDSQEFRTNGPASVFHGGLAVLPCGGATAPRFPPWPSGQVRTGQPARGTKVRPAARFPRPPAERTVTDRATRGRSALARRAWPVPLSAWVARRRKRRTVLPDPGCSPGS